MERTIIKHIQPLFGASWRIISWNLRGNLCESCAITRLIWVLVHSLQGRGHLPASTSGAKILIFSPISSQGPTFMAQSSWNLMNASSLSLASVMMLDPVQATPPTAELTASTAPARMPLLVVVGRPGRLVGGLLLGGPLGPPGRLGGGLCSGL